MTWTRPGPVSINSPEPQDWRHRGMCKRLVSERDLNSHICDLQRCSLAHAGKRISAGQAHVTVSEDRLHQKAHGCCRRSSRWLTVVGDVCWRSGLGRIAPPVPAQPCSGMNSPRGLGLSLIRSGSGLPGSGGDRGYSRCAGQARAVTLEP
jgi:hypothetical protein